MKDLFKFSDHIRDRIWYHPFISVQKMLPNPSLRTLIENYIKPSVYVHILNNVQFSTYEIDDRLKSKLQEYDFR